MKGKMEHLEFYNLNCKIHYWYRKGTENKWVMFFHGAGLNHEMFEEQFEAFDDTYNLIAWDARGHGMSKLEDGMKFHFKDMISDCKELYKIYGIDKAILIGQSMGGNLAQDIAYYSPELVEKLVLIDCSKNTGKLSVMEKCLLKSSRFIFNCYPWKLLISQITNACSDKESVRKYVNERFQKLEKASFIDIIMELTGCLHEDPQFTSSQPVMLICGSDDKLGNIKKIAEEWAKCDNNCTLHIIENAGHNSNQDDPDKVNALIRKFLMG